MKGILHLSMTRTSTVEEEEGIGEDRGVLGLAR